jgi:hypothetical protein
LSESSQFGNFHFSSLVTASGHNDHLRLAGVKNITMMFFNFTKGVFGVLTPQSVNLAFCGGVLSGHFDHSPILRGQLPPPLTYLEFQRAKIQPLPKISYLFSFH